MDYKAYVESLAQQGKNELFLNSGPIHAAIVMSRIFKYSQNEIFIYCGGFNGAVSNDEEYLNYLEQFLKRGKLRALVEEDLSKNPSSKIFNLFNKYPNSIEVYIAVKKVVNLETQKSVHFTVGDNKMVRLETGTTDYTAQVNFNDIDKAAEMKNLFESIWIASQKNRIVFTA